MADPLRLLLVNRDTQKRKELADFISSCTSYEVVEASSGRAAVSILKTDSIDCVVSDIYLGDLDGWRLARLIRSGVLSCSDATPILMVSSTWCERIAETTAREFDIDHLIPFAEYQRLEPLLQQVKGLCVNARLPRVLAIEDASETAVLIQRILRGRFIVDIAADGPTGIALWRENKHPIILLDVMLPGMSGPEVMDTILSEKPDQSIVIMTAHGSMDLAEELMLKGAADFLSKPFRAEQLRKVCEIASRREDFLISNQQFADTIESLQLNKQALYSQAKEHQLILDNLSTSVVELDNQGRVAFMNRSWVLLTGQSPVDLQGKQFTEFTCSESYSASEQVANAIDMLLSGRSNRYRLEFQLQDKFSQGAWVEARFNRIHRENSSVAISVAIDDISARKQAEQRLHHLAIHDALTGLYNRVYFENELTRITSIAKRGDSTHCLVYIDLDHFKAINDTLGHQQGDTVLIDVAERLQHRVRDTDRLCRIGGDEFALLLVDTDIDEGCKIAAGLCDLVAQSHCNVGGQAFKVTCSIGITAIYGDESSPQNYLQQADIALYVAKTRGRNCIHSFSVEDKESGDVKSSMQWLHAVQHAIENDQLLLHFQPIYNIANHHVEYYEALVRLDIDGQVVYPGDFIPALERFEDISLLDQHVISKAIKCLADYPRLTKIAINLSAQAFRNDSLVPLIEEKLRQFGVEPQRVIFELTESASLSNLGATQEMVTKLRSMGCAFSIDDFGTGFSTFSYLKSLPAETVKIDGSFIKGITSNPIDLALVKSIHEVSTALGKKTVAEFVEDQDTLNILRDIKVDYAQGYHVGRPMPIEQLFDHNEVELVLAED